MSVNLTLGIERYFQSGAPAFCNERLRLDWQDYDLWDQMRADAIPLREGAQWYTDEGIQLVKDDAYGDQLAWLPAFKVARHLGGLPLVRFDAATLAYLTALPPETRIVLWWS